MRLRLHGVGFRYRVGRAWSMIGDSVHADDCREFKTIQGAQEYQRRLALAGEQAVLQVGVIQWLPQNEAAEEMQRLVKEGRSIE